MGEGHCIRGTNAYSCFMQLICILPLVIKETNKWQDLCSCCIRKTTNQNEPQHVAGVITTKRVLRSNESMD
ncbi:hypothetical protein XELAEV_18027859mg [Xenopus laevis]|uniref:Uncharacterized protein n=1 Tax=Xenopus laevis TaxID=8355 RepID=A0A974HKM3_XENLA|nr:hypothetical protein XELAEV_18027859mg [Xenopus laevis]